DGLVQRRDRGAGRTGLEIGPVLEAEAGEAAVARLEEGDGGVEVVKRLHAIAGIVAAARIGPYRVALLEAGAQRDDLGLALGPAGGVEGDGGGETDLVEHHRFLWPFASA